MKSERYLSRARNCMVRYLGNFVEPVIATAQGCRIVDVDGREYLDFTSGQICATIGHNHPAVVDVLNRCDEYPIHQNSYILSPPVIELCERVSAMLPPGLDKCLVLTTGSESNEIAFRMAKMATGRHEIVSFVHSFHGLTAATSSSTYSIAHKGYGPGVVGSYALPSPYCYRCPLKKTFPDCEYVCLESGFHVVDAQSTDHPAAVIVEPILSAGGLIEPPRGFLAELKEMCHDRGALLILDEAQTAFGRTGKMFAFEHHGVVPDILTLSKTIGGGIPISITVISKALEQTLFDRGFTHITSHVSDPLPAKVALAVLDVVERDHLDHRAETLGNHLRSRLESMAEKFSCIGDIRGRGLLMGIELVRDLGTREPAHEEGLAVTMKCLEMGLSLNIVRHGMCCVLRLAPPLTISQEELDQGLDRLEEAVAEVFSPVAC